MTYVIQMEITGETRNDVLAAAGGLSAMAGVYDVTVVLGEAEEIK